MRAVLSGCPARESADRQSAESQARRAACLALCGLAVSGLPCRATAQDSAHAHIATGRAHLRAARLDSAALLLREALDTTGHASRVDQVEAWMLLGVTSFFRADDSGTRDDFRRALALDPQLKADGLVGYDSALVDLFNSQRSVAAAGEASRRPDYTLVDCTRTCPENVVLPRLIAVEALEGLPPDRFAVEHHRYGAMIVQFIVDTAGRVAPASVRLVSND